ESGCIEVHDRVTAPLSHRPLHDALPISGGVTNALNMPSLSAEEAPKLRPYMALAENLGSLIGQLAHDNLTQISVEVEGAAAELKDRKSTRLNSSHVKSSYAVFCLNKKRK